MAKNITLREYRNNMMLFLDKSILKNKLLCIGSTSSFQYLIRFWIALAVREMKHSGFNKNTKNLKKKYINTG